MLKKLPYELSMIVQQNHGLNRYLHSLLEEVPYTQRSMLYDGRHGGPDLTPEGVKDAWMEQLKQLEKHDDTMQLIFEFDSSQLEKFGPQGGHAPIGDLMNNIIMPQFDLAGQFSAPAFQSSAWQGAKAKFVKLLHQHGVNGLRSWAFSQVVSQMHGDAKLESNSGFPDFTRRNNPDVKSRAINDAESGAWKSYPAIALFRTYNGKTRLVWMFPMSANVVEASYFFPLQQKIMESELSSGFFSPWKGFDAVRSVVTSAYASGMQVAASDFTSTDAHFQLQASLEVYDCLKQCFQPQYAEGLKDSIVHMHNIPLVVQPDLMVVGPHGVASGSNWTNFIETCFDIILGYYVEHITKGSVRLLYAIGDDMSWASKAFREGFVHELEDIGTSVGQVIKAEKTMAFADHVKSLQRLFIRGYFQENSRELRAVYSTVRALKSSVYPERSIAKGKDARDHYVRDMFCARQFMILENCMDHPLFKEFVQFVCKGSRYLVPFAQLSDRRLDAIHREANLIPGLNTTYNQEKKDKPLSAFASIQYARSLG